MRFVFIRCEGRRKGQAVLLVYRWTSEGYVVASRGEGPGQESMMIYWCSCSVERASKLWWPSILDSARIRRSHP